MIELIFFALPFAILLSESYNYYDHLRKLSTDDKNKIIDKLSTKTSYYIPNHFISFIILSILNNPSQRPEINPMINNIFDFMTKITDSIGNNKQDNVINSLFTQEHTDLKQTDENITNIFSSLQQQVSNLINHEISTNNNPHLFDFSDDDMFKKNDITPLTENSNNIASPNIINMIDDIINEINDSGNNHENIQNNILYYNPITNEFSNIDENINDYIGKNNPENIYTDINNCFIDNDIIANCYENNNVLAECFRNDDDHTNNNSCLKNNEGCESDDGYGNNEDCESDDGNCDCENNCENNGNCVNNSNCVNDADCGNNGDCGNDVDHVNNNNCGSDRDCGNNCDHANNNNCENNGGCDNNGGCGNVEGGVLGEECSYDDICNYVCGLNGGESMSSISLSSIEELDNEIRNLEEKEEILLDKIKVIVGGKKKGNKK